MASPNKIEKLLIPQTALRRKIEATFGNTTPASSDFHFPSVDTPWLHEFLTEHKLESLSGTLAIERQAQVVRVKGVLHFEPLLECIRSLTEFREKLDAEVDVIFADAQLAKTAMTSSESSPTPLDDASLSFYEYSNAGIELDELILDSLRMALPDRPLCREDCKGLCTDCGANLNDINVCGATNLVVKKECRQNVPKA